MQKEENYLAAAEGGRGFPGNLDSQNPVFHARASSAYEQVMTAADEHPDDEYNCDNSRLSSSVIHGGVMVNYMHNNNYTPTNVFQQPYQQQQKWQQQQQQLLLEPSIGMNSDVPTVDRTLSFADVMQFSDFGPKLALHYSEQDYQQQQDQEDGTDNFSRDVDSTGVDPVYFLKFPVLSNPINFPGHGSSNHNDNNGNFDGGFEDISGREFSYNNKEQDGGAGPSTAGASSYNDPVQLEFLGNAAGASTDDNVIDITGDKIGGLNVEGGAAPAGKNSSNKRKRPRTIKTTEEVESQRMTHIAVERNRRKQMNEHLRVLRSLMPSSYVQRGDQASIIGGAIEFVRELEQLLQCLESQKRRRLYGDQPGPPRPMGDSTSEVTLGGVQQLPQQPLGFPPCNQDDQLRLADQLDPTGGGALLREETAESKSCIADVEVKVLGFDALIKILSRRRPGQLIKAIAALEDLHFTILHTNITTIEQTVLYSFNVKVANEARFTAEDIASSVQQIFTFIHANTNVI